MIIGTKTIKYFIHEYFNSHLLDVGCKLFIKIIINYERITLFIMNVEVQKWFHIFCMEPYTIIYIHALFFYFVFLIILQSTTYVQQ